MNQNSSQNGKKPSSQNISTTKEEKSFSQQLKEMPYSTERIGQAFIMRYKKPTNYIDISQKGNGSQNNEKNTQSSN